jgi:hypothetical protein
MRHFDHLCTSNFVLLLLTAACSGRVVALSSAEGGLSALSGGPGGNTSADAAPDIGSTSTTSSSTGGDGGSGGGTDVGSSSTVGSSVGGTGGVPIEAGGGGGNDQPPPVVDAGSDGRYDIVVINGWQWDVNCPLSIDEFCAQQDIAGARCIRKWSDAMVRTNWCGGGIDFVGVLGECHGYLVAEALGSGAFFTYYYDATTGDLVHVDSDAIPSFTKCVAGVSGSRFDVFGCGPGGSSCP